MDTKKCYQCKRELPLDRIHFNRSKRAKDGFYATCKECRGYKFGVRDQSDIPSDMKRCSRCSRILPRESDYFFVNTAQKDGLTPNCKECVGVKFTPDRLIRIKDGMKYCNMCKRWLPHDTTHFARDKNQKGGFYFQCKECGGWEFKDTDELVPKDGMKLCPKCRRTLPCTADYFFRKSKCSYGLQSRCKDCAKAYRKEKGYSSEATKNRSKDRWNTDPNYKMASLLRNRIYYALKDNRKSASTMELLGCTIDELKLHLESLFTDGMTWGTHGINGWHIDHVKPCAMFDLSDSRQQKECFNYKNLQPLWMTENLVKHSWHEGIHYTKGC